MFGRGDRSVDWYQPFNRVDSELSGNVIDLCPVGALTNKPFRYSARAWELMAKAIDGRTRWCGFQPVVSHPAWKVLRAVPRENESTNETWLSDRDRYSHFGLNSDERVLEPMVKVDGQWQSVSWDEGIRAATEALREICYRAVMVVNNLGVLNVCQRFN